MRDTQTNEASPTMTIKEFCYLTGLSPRTAGRMAQRGDFRAVKVGDRWIINRADVMDLLSSVLD